MSLLERLNHAFSGGIMFVQPTAEKITTDVGNILQGGPKNCTATVSQQIVLQCVPIGFVLSNLSVAYVVSHEQIIF